jgi:hypothetical protein
MRATKPAAPLRRPRWAFLAAALLAAMIASVGQGSGAVTLAGDPGLGGFQRVTHRDIAEVLRGPLRELARTTSSGAERVALSSHLVVGRGRSTTEIAVTVRLDGAAAALAPEVIAAGARIAHLGDRVIEAYVAPDRLAALAGLPGVRSIRPILRRPSETYVSPAVALHGASAWQASGLTGAGIKVGIIDGGFQGLAARLGTELPATVHVQCYTAVGAPSSRPADCENGETHGTAVAETIVDMAPGAALYLASPISPLDQQQSIAWMLANGVRIINASWSSGFLFDGPGDGSSPYTDTTYAAVDQATAGGALWVNSAGNDGESGWTGGWTDVNANGWLEWAGGDERNSITLAAGASATIAIRWADPWGASANDYDLALFSGSTLVASSEDVQAGAGDPYEFLEYRAPVAGTYDIEVVRVSGAPTTRLQLLVHDWSLKYQVATGTLPAPADSANPGMVSVGAVDVSSPTTIEPYSSRGPTLDGRVKPDLVAADCAPTTIDPRFCGTSESAPFVSGAGAQILEANPSLTPAQLADWLRGHAVALGSPVPNGTFGWGRLDLGPAPAPAALAFVWPPTGALAGDPLTGQPTIRLVDASGLTVSAGPASSAPVTISLATNSTGATLSCPDGLSRAGLAGVAYFAGCSIDQPGVGYTIQAQTAGLPPIVSSAFDILAAGSALPLTLGVIPNTVTAGASVSLAGTFGPAPATAGRPLDFLFSLNGLDWVPAASGSADVNGQSVVSVTPNATGWYRVFFPGTADLAAATSYPVRLSVRQSIALAASVRPPRAIRRATSVTFTSTVRPAVAGLPRASVQYVVFRRVNGSWVRYRRIYVTADANGRAKLAWRFTIPGKWYVRSMARATPYAGASAWSSIARYDVR